MADELGKTSWKLAGEPISSGIAIGEVFLFRQINLDALEKTRFPVDDVAKEGLRLDGIIQKTISQLQEILGQKDLSVDVSEIFHVQLRILRDAGFVQEFKSLVDAQKVNIEYVLANQIKVIEEKFQALENELLRTRFLDIQDVYYRILRNCLEIEHVRSNPFKRLQKPVIFIAQKLLPSDLALLDYDKLLGILMEEGSSVSHVAIIAKSLGIPAIIKIPGISSIVRAHDTVIMDAHKGMVIINPSDSILASYAGSEKKLSSSQPKALKHRKIAECMTIDGIAIRLEANIGSIKDAHEALENGAAGIGLLRSELYYLSRSVKPTVEEESDYYAAIIALFKNRPVTIRLLDLGADKTLPYLRSFEESNPQLGIRGIRYLLRNRDLFRDHVQSIIRASKAGRLNVLIPFVAVEDDVIQALGEIHAMCARESVDRGRLGKGIMVEIPAAALSLSRFWPYLDFVNIGTNDLAQYLFAASREDGNVELYRQKAHPVLLNLLAHCAASGKKARKNVAVCGELAADPQGALLLVGLGIRSLSMQPSSIPLVRKAINKSSFKDLQKAAKKALVAHDFNDTI
jgi:phosphoenolpyruvate-protein phosphotransferase